MLRGDVKLGALDVFYFSLDPLPVSGNDILGMWPPQGRYLFLINRDHGVLRLASDGYGYCQRRIRSGAHRLYQARPGEPVKEMLADLILRKGENASTSAFALGILLLSDCPRGYAETRLQTLAKSGDLTVADAACEALNGLNIPCERRRRGTEDRRPSNTKQPGNASPASQTYLNQP